MINELHLRTRDSLLRSGILAVLLMGLSLVLTAQTFDAREIAGRVDQHYNSLRTLQTEFTETYEGNGLHRAETGTLWLKKPGKMRWDYRSPKEKLFVSDGKNAWFYVPGDRQARKTSAKKLDDLRSPLGFLLGKTKLDRELDGLSLAHDIEPIESGNSMLRGVPKALADRVSEVLLEINPEHRIVRILAEEIDGAVTEFRFHDQKENIAISDQQFRFDLPAGVEVIEGNFGQ